MALTSQLLKHSISNHHYANSYSVIGSVERTLDYYKNSFSSGGLEINQRVSKKWSPHDQVKEKAQKFELEF